MIEEERNPKVHHMTVKAARTALAGRQISQESYRSVLRGVISLERAKAIGRDGTSTPDATGGHSGPGTTTETSGRASAEDHQGGTEMRPQPVSRISKDDATQECWCTVCGQQTSPRRRFKPGHDQRAKGIIKRAVQEDKVDELDARLKEYGQERGML
jgi:hypothetical protein